MTRVRALLINVRKVINLSNYSRSPVAMSRITPKSIELIKQTNKSLMTRLIALALVKQNVIISSSIFTAEHTPPSGRLALALGSL